MPYKAGASSGEGTSSTVGFIGFLMTTPPVNAGPVLPVQATSFGNGKKVSWVSLLTGHLHEEDVGSFFEIDVFN